MKVLFIDTETTGLDPKVHSVISLGVISARLENGIFVEEGEGFEWYFGGDGLVWDSGAALVNGWPGKYKDTPKSPRDFLYRFVADPLFAGSMIGGHNVGFDIGMLDAATGGAFSKAMSHRKVDSQSMAFPLVALGHAKSTGLAEMQKLFGDLFDDPSTQHTALADARASLRLTNRLIALMTPTVDQALALFFKEPK